MINKWMVLSIILMVMIVGIIIRMEIDKDTNYKLGNIEIKKSSLDSISESYSGEPFSICDIQKNKCIIIAKLE